MSASCISSRPHPTDPPSAAAPGASGADVLAVLVRGGKDYSGTHWGFKLQGRMAKPPALAGRPWRPRKKAGVNARAAVSRGVVAFRECLFVVT